MVCTSGGGVYVASLSQIETAVNNQTTCSQRCIKVTDVEQALTGCWHHQYSNRKKSEISHIGL